MPRAGHITAALILSAVVALPGRECAAKDAPPADAQGIRRAVERGSAYIKTRQRRDGTWDGDGNEEGATALAVYALLKADTPPGDAAVSAGMKWVLASPQQQNPARIMTYTLALTAMMLASVLDKAGDPPGTNVTEACRERLRATARLLVAAQHRCRAEGGVLRAPGAARTVPLDVRPNPGASGYDLRPFGGIDGGAWGYSLADSNYVDNSNTQFALLGLRAAQNVADSCSDTNIAIPREVWARALARLVSTQAAAGEWDYGTVNLGSRGFQETMTPAGISGLTICISSLATSPNAATIARTPEIARALSRLERYMYPPPNVMRFDSSGLNRPNRTGYMFYSVERACMQAGLKTIGAHDWYTDGATEILRTQQSDGSWSGDAWYSAAGSRHASPRSRDNTIETSFCLLFLTKAFVSTPAQKPYTPSP